MKTLLRWLVRWLFRFRAYNPEVLATPGPVLLIPNHQSLIDWLFLGVCLDADWKFVVSSVAAQTSWLHRKISINRRTFLVADPYQPTPYGPSPAYWIGLERVMGSILLGIVTHDANLLVVYPVERSSPNPS